MRPGVLVIGKFPAGRDRADARAVVATILESPQTLEQELGRSARANVSDDSTHDLHHSIGRE